MKPNTPTVINMAHVTSFLCHPGSRLGYFGDPPGPSIAVEGGFFDGNGYAGRVFTPTVPSPDASRVDTVVVDPNTGALELVEGTEGSASPPALKEGTLQAPVANVIVKARANSKVLIESSDIWDRRTLVARPRQTVQNILVDQVIVNVGHKHGPNDGVNLFKAGDTAGPFICKSSWVNRTDYGLSFDYGRSTGIDVQLSDSDEVTGKAATDFFLTVQLYGSVLQTGTSESHRHFAGVTWKRLLTSDYAGNASFRIEVIASPQDGGKNGAAVFWSGKDTSNKGPREDKNVALHIQLWQRITS